MGLTDIFKPKYKHSDGEVRREAVKNITDQQILTDIAKNDELYFVRAEAVKNINNQEVLIHVAKNDEDEDVRMEAVKKIDDDSTLVDILKNEGNEDVRIAAIRNPNFINEKILSKISLENNEKTQIQKKRH